MFNYTNLMRELEIKRTYLTDEMNRHSTDNKEKKKFQKEVVKINALLNNMVDYKINYVDEQSIQEVVEKKPKSFKQSKQPKELEKSYGISGMINK
jgi:DNA-binding IscR family transcriptional regulator